MVENVETSELNPEQQKDFESKRENVKKGRGRTFTPEQRAKGLETLRKKKEENALIKLAEKQKKQDERNSKLESAKKTLIKPEKPEVAEKPEEPSAPVDINEISEDKPEPSKKSSSRPKKVKEVEYSDSEMEETPKNKRGTRKEKSAKELYYERKLALLDADQSGYDGNRQAYNDYMRRQDGLKTAQYRYENYMDTNTKEMLRKQAFPYS